jgi:hypothetical protein
LPPLESGGDQDAGAGDRFIHRANLGEAAFEHQLGASADLGRRENPAAGVLDGEGEGGGGHEVDLEAGVAGGAGGGFTALLGADAGDDHPADAAFGQPSREVGAGERAVIADLTKTERAWVGRRLARCGAAG